MALAVETESKDAKWKVLLKKLEDTVNENSGKELKDRKTLTNLFNDFAKDNDTTSSSTSYYYYNFIKKEGKEIGRKKKKKRKVKETKEIKEIKEVEPKELKEIEGVEENNIEEKPSTFHHLSSVDENIENYSKISSNDKVIMSPKSIYKIGEIVKVEVVSIVNFGVFVKTKEGFDGLIHISEITGKIFVDEPSDYFYIGEKIDAKIIKFNPDNKIGLSVKALGGKNKINSNFIGLKNVIQHDDNSDAKEIENHTETNYRQETEMKEIVKSHESAPAEIIQTNESDMDNIVQYIKKYSGNTISPKSLSELKDVIENFGMFKTTLSLLEVLRDLDISSVITDRVKEKLEGECLR